MMIVMRIAHDDGVDDDDDEMTMTMMIFNQVIIRILTAV